MVEDRTEKEIRDPKKRESATGSMRTGPEAGERTTRQGAAVDTGPDRPVAAERPLYGTANDAARGHARDENVYPDWERQPQVNAPRDVGVPTAQGQADVARLRAGRRDTDDRGAVERLKEKARDVREEIDRSI